MNGKELNRKWQVGAKHALYNHEGTWYHQLKDFPGALFDSKGYLVFDSQEEFLACPYLRIKKDVYIPQGLAAIPGYISLELAKEARPIDATPSLAGNETSFHREGKPKIVHLTKYERNPQARLKCIRFYGATCQVCEFDFGQVYGSLVNGLIHVHHLTPLASIGQEYELDPIRDLRPVCPNCHAVIHSCTPPYTIAQVQGMRSLGAEAQ